ncbi:glycoside hydrolase family 3 protein [Actinosynnema pretiosum]|uniref:Beta-glucosidase n=1 Tax=Actinosynnema pretiosum TaxID=42197 RepID=A0A290ZAK7_9PSEU|nr:exo 1,3/1,4-beta-D-glucan glucohydrolase [Actinosynnema pretiosum]ATE56038.1 beta-glucosidase [Actinosynnema pretiosum]
MSRRHLSTALVALLTAGLFTAAAAPASAHGGGPKQPVIGEPRTEHGCARIEKSLPTLATWPKVTSQVKSNPADERKVRELVSKMTLAEKIGQMTQPEIIAITPDEVRQYNIGSVLNGGGTWPNRDKHASTGDWLALADSFWQASVSTRLKVPVLWGIDAVHGNNNVYGATVFPHNIGLGAAKDPCLVRDVSAATAEQIRATGQDWAFAPTLAVPQDDRWGRTYEGFSEDPRIVRAYGYEATKGLQDDAKRRIGEDGVIATAKHYIGDGGTTGGKDQGVNPSSEADMINVHGQGYYGALAAGAQSVMVSFNSWTNEDQGINEGKLHGSKRALDDILKNKMGFDGLVVTDWNGIGQIPGCTNSSCPQAINAGVDVVMVPADWKAFIANTTAQVESGEIPQARIDDAVTRILRVKLRSGLFDAPKPSQREHAGDKALQHENLAREAVRKSQVLLKNNGNVLPLSPRAKVLVVGKSADSMQNQTGGWTLTWQGTSNTNADFPNGTTILGGLKQALGEKNVVFSETGDVDPEGFDAVIAVIGETPYAEGNGDLGRRSLEAAKLYPNDLAVLDKVSGKGAPVVTVYVSGRPLHVNKELNRSDAFVAAWLPGTEGGGVADQLVRGRHTFPGFTGTLSYSWPKGACQTPLNPGQEGYDPLFKPGYGLKTWERSKVGRLDETSPETGCGGSGGGGSATEDLDVFIRQDIAPYKSFIGSAENWGGTEIGPDATAAHAEISVAPSDVNVQADALRTKWTGVGPAQVYLQQQGGVSDLRGYRNTNGALVFDVIVHQKPAARTVLSAHCTYPCLGEVNATGVFNSLAVGEKATVKVPVSCFEATGLDLEGVNTPFLVYTDGQFEASFANVRWVPQAGADPDARTCAELSG